MHQLHGTTILSARRGSQVALGGDGQVTLGAVVAKASARKVRRLYHEKILAGFAGGTADAFTLFERFEGRVTPGGPWTSSRRSGTSTPQRQRCEAFCPWPNPCLTGAAARIAS